VVLAGVVGDLGQDLVVVGSSEHGVALGYDRAAGELLHRGPPTVEGVPCSFSIGPKRPIDEQMLQIADPAWPALLERTCSEDLISPVFQPIVDTSRGEVCGYEGLSRIHGPPDAGGPQEWFAAAALHGYAGRLEATAIGALLEKRHELPDNCFLSINLSPDSVLAPEVAHAMSGTYDLSGLVVEITEQSPVDDYEALSEALTALRARGAMVAVDDTGSGYASLSHLLALRPQFVKLDRALVAGLDRDPQRAAAVAAIGAFANELDAWLVAEGVEREAELERLIELGVPLVQGYLLGRPLPEMSQLASGMSNRLRDRQRSRRAGELSGLARPAPLVRTPPQIVAETTVLVGAGGRPEYVFVPAGGERANRHAAMCVQPGDGISSVALRAAARQSEDRYGPICLCNDLGRPIGVIAIESLLEALARR
jgi:EAL domain-containing protein (putative c-di-GMP-specific phosphodiesterase class I)